MKGNKAEMKEQAEMKERTEMKEQTDMKEQAEMNEKKKSKPKKEKKEKKPVDPATKKKRRRIVFLVIAVIFILVILLGKALAGNAPMPVVTESAVKGEIEQTISTGGTVESDEIQSYFSEVNVKVGTVHVKAGDAVKKGDLLVSYDADELQTELELAKLQQQSGEGNYQSSVQSNNENAVDLREANVNLEVLDQQIEDTKAYITGLENKIKAKKSEIELFGTKLQITLLDWQDRPDTFEYKNLQRQIQQNNYELNNNKEIKGWEAELEVYNDMLAGYQEYRTEMKSQKSSAEAGKMTAGAGKQLEADNQTKSIEATRKITGLEEAQKGIVADFDGVVTEINAEEGGALAEGSKILELQSTQAVSVNISVTKYDLAKIAIGQKAKVTIVGKEYEGEVARINKMAEKNESGSFVVKAEIKLLNPDSDVYLGVDAKVVISTAQETDVVLVPVAAVNVDMDGEFVYVVEEGILIKKPVETGISSDTMVQIVSGVEEGAQLVTEVTGDLKEGMAVLALPNVQEE